MAPWSALGPPGALKSHFYVFGFDFGRNFGPSGDPQNLEKSDFERRGKFFEGRETSKRVSGMGSVPFFLNFVTRVREPSIF